MSRPAKELTSSGLGYYRGFVDHRTRWWIDFESDEDYEGSDRKQVTTWAEANGVSSLTRDGTHMPTLDLDVPCELFRSSTWGHGHLYINHEMSWFRYRVLLRVLVWCGIIEKGYYKASVKRKQTMLRTPDTKKGATA